MSLSIEEKESIINLAVGERVKIDRLSVFCTAEGKYTISIISPLRLENITYESVCRALSILKETSEGEYGEN